MKKDKEILMPKIGKIIFDHDRKDRKNDAIGKNGYLLFDPDPIL